MSKKPERIPEPIRVTVRELQTQKCGDAIAVAGKLVGEMLYTGYGHTRAEAVECLVKHVGGLLGNEYQVIAEG